eukprot:s827_g6.t1
MASPPPVRRCQVVAVFSDGSTFGSVKLQPINTGLRKMGVPAEGRRGVLPWLVLCVLGSLLWLTRDASGQQAFTAMTDAVASHGAQRSGGDQSLRAWPLSAPTSQPLQAPASRGSGLSPQIQKRLAALKREAILVSGLKQ